MDDKEKIKKEVEERIFALKKEIDKVINLAESEGIRY